MQTPQHLPLLGSSSALTARPHAHQSSSRGGDLVLAERQATRERVASRGARAVSKGGHTGNDHCYYTEAREQRHVQQQQQQRRLPQGGHGNDASATFNTPPPPRGLLEAPGAGSAGTGLPDSLPHLDVEGTVRPAKHPLRDALVEEARQVARDLALPIAALPTHFNVALAEAYSGDGSPNRVVAATSSDSGPARPSPRKPPTTAPAATARGRRAHAAPSGPGLHLSAQFVDGERSKQLASAVAAPTSRADVIASIDALEGDLASLSDDAPVVERLSILDDSMVNVVRQCLVGCVERGVWLEYLRVAVFGCVNGILESHSALETETAELAETIERLQAKVSERDQELHAVKEALGDERRATKRREILDITSAAKRSNEYVKYATAHFEHATKTIEAEGKEAEVKNRIFSLALRDNNEKRAAHDRYLEALEQVKTMQHREGRFRQQIGGLTEHNQALESLVARLQRLIPRDDMTKSIMARPTAANAPGTDLDWRDVAIGDDDAHAEVCDAATDVDGLEPEPEPELNRKFSVFGGGARKSIFGGSQSFMNRRGSMAPASMRKPRFSIAAGVLGRKSIVDPAILSPTILESHGNSPTSPMTRKRAVRFGGNDDDENDPASGSRRVSRHSSNASILRHRTTEAEVQATPEFDQVDGISTDTLDFAETINCAAGTSPVHVDDWVAYGSLVEAECQTDGGAAAAAAVSAAVVDFAFGEVPEVGPARVRSKPPATVPDSSFDVATRRLNLQAAKQRPPKWVLSTVSQIYAFVVDHDPIITPELDFSASALLYFRSRYGLEKLSDAYVADFVVNAKRDLPKSRRLNCFVRFVGLHRFFALPEAIAAREEYESWQRDNPEDAKHLNASSTTGGGGKSTNNSNFLAVSARPTGRHSLMDTSGGSGIAVASNVSVPWMFFAHYAFVLAAVKKLVPRKSMKEWEEAEAFELPPFGALQLLKHAYKKRLSEAAMGYLVDALNEFDRSALDSAGHPVQPLANTRVTSAVLTRAWPLDLLLEVLAFSTVSLFPELLEESVKELEAAKISAELGIRDPRMWNPAV